LSEPANAGPSRQIEPSSDPGDLSALIIAATSGKASIGSPANTMDPRLPISPVAAGITIASIRSPWSLTANERFVISTGKPDFTAHDLRRTAATRMTGELKIPRFAVGRVLNHLEPGVTGVYDRYAYDDEKRDALGRWAQLVVEGIVGGERQVSKVLAFRNS
jgi:hypothetical protein